MLAGYFKVYQIRLFLQIQFLIFVVRFQEDQHLWHIVFYISAFIYFVGNLVFIIFGKAEIQWWNDPTEVKAREERKVHNDHEVGSHKHI